MYLHTSLVGTIPFDNKFIMKFRLQVDHFGTKTIFGNNNFATFAHPVLSLWLQMSITSSISIF
jgi:hypothetical protein